MKRTRILLLLVIAASMPAQLGFAQGGSDGPWQNNVFVYGWAAGVTGTTQLGTREIPVDVKFGDILDNLQAGFMGHYRGASERFSFVADLIYLDLGKSREGRVLQRADLRQVLVDLTGAYRFSPVVEAFAGIRITDVETKVKLGLPSFPELGTIERGDSKTFYDPIVGARLLTPLDENRRWWVQAQADIGGFDVGTKLTWQAAGNAGFRVTDWFSLWGGYRALGMDFENLGAREQYSQDVVLHGPSFGLGFHF